MKFPEKMLISIAEGIGSKYFVACPKITDHNIEGCVGRIIGVYELKRIQNIIENPTTRKITLR